MSVALRKLDIFFFIILGLIVIAVYSNTLKAPFVFDDRPNIENNPAIQLTELSIKNLKDAWLGSPNPNRPIANISFALNYYADGNNVRGYHVINILIHVINGILLYILFKTTLCLAWTDPSRSEMQPHGASADRQRRVFSQLDPAWISFWAAAIWLVHPIQTQSVTYIVQRMNTLASLFYLLSLILYVRARISQQYPVNSPRKASFHPYVLYAGSLFAGLLACGSKETAATLPFFILLYELYFFQNMGWAWVRRNYLFIALLAVLFFITTAVFLGNHPWDKILAGYGGREFTLPQRVLTEFRVIIFYLSLLLLPHPERLNLEHDFPLSISVFDPATTLLSIGAIAGLLAAALYLARKNRLLSFCILWFLGNLMIESSVIGLEILFEHRLYMPSMFVILAAVTVIFRYLTPKRLQRVIFCLVVFVCAFWTLERNAVWQNEIGLLKDCVAKSPHKARPHYNLGVALAEKGHSAEAIRHYHEALRINPKYASVHTNLGIELYALGKIDEAISHYTKALRIKPGFANAHLQLGIAQAGLGRMTVAVHHYKEALRYDPAMAEAHNNLGNIYFKQGNSAGAIRQFVKALEKNKKFAAAYNNLGAVMFQTGKYDQAVVLFTEALRINSKFDDARNNLALASQAAKEKKSVDPNILH